ncbi:MAG: hypothetical protein HFJ09_01185 [Lachnospiraceae bacterium]|nr:hypothetical protein [Lachnospiraceae bacterium]
MRKESVIDKRWIISQSQWQLLLSQYEKELKYGIYFNTEKQEKRQIIENLYKMVKKEILLLDGSRFIVHNEYRRLLELSAKAKKGCFLENKDEMSNLFLYLGEECVICETSSIQKDCFIFSIKKREEILSYLFEIGFFPRYCTMNGEKEIPQTTFLMVEKENWNLPEDYKGEKMVTFLDLEKEEEFARLFLLKEEGEEYLLWEEKNRRGKGLLSEENLKKIWKELVDNAVCGSGNACI